MKISYGIHLNTYGHLPCITGYFHGYRCEKQPVSHGAHGVVPGHCFHGDMVLISTCKINSIIFNNSLILKQECDNHW